YAILYGKAALSPWPAAPQDCDATPRFYRIVEGGTTAARGAGGTSRSNRCPRPTAHAGVTRPYRLKARRRGRRPTTARGCSTAAPAARRRGRRRRQNPAGPTAPPRGPRRAPAARRPPAASPPPPR